MLIEQFNSGQEEHFIYIPLSSFVILLVILITCASRRRKADPFLMFETNLENDIKGDYAIMCFPCLKKKPELKNYDPSPDLTDQFEYIVEKYTIRKVPLLLANTTEDLIERQEELEMIEAPPSQLELAKEDYANFQLTSDINGLQQGQPCITVAANTICPARKPIKDKNMPADVLECMSPIPRPNNKNANYVVIPTKGSLRNKDIMITKREITNQYLNNFSSVFVDNLKDQVPKDPENYPNLSRPYTSAFKNLPLPDTFLKAKAGENGKAKIKRGKVQKVAYSFPTEVYAREDESTKAEEAFYDSDSGSKCPTTDVPESEFQEENENETIDMTDKSKSLVLLNESDSGKDLLEGTANPFKTTIRSSGSEFDQTLPQAIDLENPNSSHAYPKEEWTNAKVTYEDIQALDVGYEFTSCEKLGVKPKMTRIHYPHEGERSKDMKQVGDSKTSRSYFLMDQPQLQITSSKVTRANLKSKGHQRMSDLSFLSNNSYPKERVTSKSSIAETSFLPRIESSVKQPVEPSKLQNLVSTTTFTSKSEESKSQSLNDIDVSPSDAVNESVAEISKLYDLAMPVTKSSGAKSLSSKETSLSHHHRHHHHEEASIDAPLSASPTPPAKFPTASKSRSFQEAGRLGSRKEIASEVKGNDYSTYPSSLAKKSVTRVDEPETETSCSMISRESKTSSAVTSPRSSERDDGKRATLRWKIVIKHHKDDHSPRKHVHKNIKI